jgi:hypothetical protein
MNLPIVESVGMSLSKRRLRMNAVTRSSDAERYARCVQISKRVRWDIDEDIIRGRRFDTAHKFVPDGLFPGRCVHDVVSR